MRFAYTRRGGPLLDWSGPTPPSPTRAGETRSLGDFYPTQRNSNALRRYSAGYSVFPGSAVGYEHSRPLGELNLPRPGAPEVVSGYESPAPGAAIVHLGMGGFIPEGSVRGYGQQMLGADAPAAPKLDLGLVRKASALAAAYHGVKRNNGSIFWGVIWAAAALVTPFYGVFVPVWAAGQGFAQARPKSNPAKRRLVLRATARRRIKARHERHKERKQRTKKLPSATKRKTKLYLPASRPRTRQRTRPGY